MIYKLSESRSKSIINSMLSLPIAMFFSVFFACVVMPPLHEPLYSPIYVKFFSILGGIFTFTFLITWATQKSRVKGFRVVIDDGKVLLFNTGMFEMNLSDIKAVTVARRAVDRSLIAIYLYSDKGKKVIRQYESMENIFQEIKAEINPAIKIGERIYASTPLESTKVVGVVAFLFFFFFFMMTNWLVYQKQPGRFNKSDPAEKIP